MRRHRVSVPATARITEKATTSAGTTAKSER